VEDPAVSASPAGHGSRSLRGTETVLIIEDSDGVRKLMEHVLLACGYTPIVAATGEEGLRLSGKHSGPIHLLLTDIILPGISGPELATC
jgi:CheY-like chemotaxis protein